MPRGMITVCLAAIVFVWCAGCSSPSGGQAELVVKDNGRGDYVIVEPEAPTATDRFAVKELAAFLHEATGAELSGWRSRNLRMP